jgi:hypothetical protein
VNRLLLVACLVVASVGQAHGSTECDGALVKSTYSSAASDYVDWRLAIMVSEKEWNDVKKDASANATIYGVPIGATYSDFQKSVRDKQTTYGASLTRSQARNVLWTGLDPNAASPYIECLKTTVFSARGLHVAVKSATQTDISLIIYWHPEGRDPSVIKPTWDWVGTVVKNKLPTQLTAGQTLVVVGRPANQRTLVVNFPGAGDSVVLEPLPPVLPPPLEPPLVNFVEDTPSSEVASGSCGNFGAWTALCTPDKPAGWTLVTQSFELKGDRAGCRWAQCEPTSVTATKACYRFRMQGHAEECGRARNTGIQHSTGVIHAVWAHH